MCLGISPSATNSDNNLMNTSVSQNNEMTGTTQILNESGVKTVTRSHLSDIPGGLLASARVGYTQSSIYDFLAKPVRLSTVTWSTQTAGSLLINKVLPVDAFAQPVYANKLEGFLGFRGTAVIRVQVNGTKFQAGRLLVTFIPQGGVTGVRSGMRLRSLTAATQLPRVELDLATETEVIMEIPYVSPTPFYNFSDGTGSQGRTNVTVYSPIATGTGLATADVTMWVHFKDVELVAPALIVAQMSDRRPRAIKKNKNPSEQEQEGTDKGSISSGLLSMAKGASSFAKVPMLTALAGPASWALNCMAGVASAFGYSKPISEKEVTKVCENFQFNLQNCNGLDYFPNMGLDASNKMSIMPGFAGTDVDEMSLNHLTQIPSYIGHATYSTSQGVGTLISTLPVGPMLGTSTITVGSMTGYDMSPVAYFSSFFSYWRGSFVLTLKVVKTQYHSGRLLIAYNPASATPSLDGTSYLMREIIDIRETSEFRFVIPYTATAQYKDVRTAIYTASGLIGNVYIYVLNELVAPDTVAQSVDLLYEWSGGPDYELALPCPVRATTVVAAGWEAQMSDVIPAERAASRPDMNQQLVGVGSAVIEEQTLDASLYCIGERCNSILQLLKRFCRVRGLGLDAGVYSHDIRPFVIGGSGPTESGGESATISSDYLSLFGVCFAYSRGSVRIMQTLEFGSSNSRGLATCSIYPDSDTNPYKDLGSSHPPGESINFQPGDKVVSGINIPPYQKLHARLNRLSTYGFFEPVDVYTSPIRANFQVAYDGTTSVTHTYRSVGDDFTLGYFLGTPLLVNLTGSI